MMGLGLGLNISVSGSAWQPGELGSSLWGWWDANQGVSLNGSSKVLTVADRTTNARTLTQKAGTPSLTVTVSAQNGLPAITSPNTDYLQTAVISLTEPCTLAFVMKVATAGAAGVHDILFDGTAFLTQVLVVDSTPQYSLYSGSLSSVIAGNPWVSTYKSTILIFDGASSFAYINGVQTLTGDVGFSRGDPAGLTVFGASDGSRASAGSWTEGMLLSKHATAGERANIDRYFSNKYALGF